MDTKGWIDINTIQFASYITMEQQEYIKKCLITLQNQGIDLSNYCNNSSVSFNQINKLLQKHGIKTIDHEVYKMTGNFGGGHFHNHLCNHSDHEDEERDKDDERDDGKDEQVNYEEIIRRYINRDSKITVQQETIIEYKYTFIRNYEQQTVYQERRNYFEVFIKRHDINMTSYNQLYIYIVKYNQLMKIQN